MDTGSCVVEYEIQFLDADNNTVSTQYKIVKKEYIEKFTSTKRRDSVKSIKVRATHLGNSSNWSEPEKMSFTTPPAPTTTITTITNSGNVT